jgi:hypothetical protein
LQNPAELETASKPKGRQEIEREALAASRRT